MKKIVTEKNSTIDISLVHEKMYDLNQFLNRTLPFKVTSLIPFICKYSKFDKRPDSSVFIHPMIQEVCSKAVFGAEMYKILRRSKIFISLTLT